MKPRRTTYEIVWRILDYCREPRIFTHIMLYCNLNTPTARKHLDLLLSRGLLSASNTHYRTTENGLKYMAVVQAAYISLFE